MENSSLLMQGCSFWLFSTLSLFIYCF